MAHIQAWIKAARLRTLPLAVSGILLGNFLAVEKGAFDPAVGGMALLTAVLLQVLSNFANDYGDSIHGADDENRMGPDRMVATGGITTNQMKKGVITVGILAFLSGVATLLLSIDMIGYKAAGLLLILGIFSIIAAYEYTASSNPYGYQGYGDVSVLLFFGLLSVGGGYTLQVGRFDIWVLLPAFAMGLFSAGVLNINNLRDLPADQESNKKTLPVRLGLQQAKGYHLWLLALGALFTVMYGVKVYDHWWQFLFLLVLLLFYSNGRAIRQGQNPEDFAPQLKRLSIFTFIYSLLFGVSLILG